MAGTSWTRSGNSWNETFLRLLMVVASVVVMVWLLSVDLLFTFADYYKPMIVARLCMISLPRPRYYIATFVGKKIVSAEDCFSEFLTKPIILYMGKDGKWGIRYLL